MSVRTWVNGKHKQYTPSYPENLSALRGRQRTQRLTESPAEWVSAYSMGWKREDLDLSFLYFHCSGAIKVRFCYVASFFSELTHFFLEEDSANKQHEGHRKFLIYKSSVQDYIGGNNCYGEKTPKANRLKIGQELQGWGLYLYVSMVRWTFHW